MYYENVINYYGNKRNIDGLDLVAIQSKLCLMRP